MTAQDMHYCDNTQVSIFPVRWQMVEINQATDVHLFTVFPTWVQMVMRRVFCLIHWHLKMNKVFSFFFYHNKHWFTELHGVIVPCDKELFFLISCSLLQHFNCDLCSQWRQILWLLLECLYYRLQSKMEQSCWKISLQHLTSFRESKEEMFAILQILCDGFSNDCAVWSRGQKNKGWVAM